MCTVGVGGGVYFQSINSNQLQEKEARAAAQWAANEIIQQLNINNITLTMEFWSTRVGGQLSTEAKTFTF